MRPAVAVGAAGDRARAAARHAHAGDQTEVGEAVANRLGLSAEQRALREPKGQYAYVDWEAGWVLSQFKLSGFLDQPRQGRWRLTDDGRSLPFTEFRRRHTERERAKRAARLARR